MEVELATLTFVAAVPPRVTEAPLQNPVPVIVTDVPPVVDPVFGEIEEIVGALLLATSKLSKMTLPGAFASTCEVPPLTSNSVDVLGIEELQTSLYCCVQVPGTPLLPGAVSKVTAPVEV